MESGQLQVLPSCLLGSLLPFVLLKEKANETASRSDNLGLRWNLWLPSRVEVTQSGVGWVYVALSTKMQGMLPWLLFSRLSGQQRRLFGQCVYFLIEKHGPSMGMCAPFLFQRSVLVARGKHDLQLYVWLWPSVLTHILKCTLVLASLEVWCFGFQESLFIIV